MIIDQTIKDVIVMSRRNRNNNRGLYRFNGEYKRADKDKIRIVNGITLPIEGEDNIFVDEGVPIKYKKSDGKGFTKVQFELFQNWVVQSGNAVIETPSQENFQKGEAIFINGNQNLIDRIEEKENNNNQLRGNKKKSQAKVQILFIG